MLTNYQKISIFFVIFSFIIPSYARDYEDIHKLIDQIEKKIDKLILIINKTGNREVEDILQQAIIYYEAGKREYYVKCSKMKKKPLTLCEKRVLNELNKAIYIIKKAEEISTKIVNNQKIDKLIKRLSLKIKNTQKLLHEIKNYKAQGILQKGIEQYNTGVQLLDDNNPEKAYAKLVISAKLIARAESITKGIHTQDTDKMIKRLGIKIQNIEKMLIQSNNPQVKELYDKCTIFYNQAIESKSKGKITQTLVELNHTQRLITHIEILVKEIMKLIQNMDQIKININDIKKSLEQSQNQSAEILLNESINHFNKAQESLESGKIGIARTELSITIKLIEKTKSMIIY